LSQLAWAQKKAVATTAPAGGPGTAILEAEESEELTKQLEGLPCLVRWHERARVEARVALQQAELGERLIDKGQREKAGGIDVRTPRPCVT
jgi:hypothetical protein